MATFSTRFLGCKVSHTDAREVRERLLAEGHVERSEGARKWDADGNELIDYWMGHGALLLGHNFANVTDAVTKQVSRGTHFGACHELEIAWGEWVKRLVPSAERVRFTGSGTEATLMALRLARIHTNRRKVLKFFGHFHGGVITALADQAAGIAVTSSLPKGRIGVTVEIKVNFLGPADGNELVARARTLQMSGSIGVATVEIFSRNDKSERLCAFCTATMRALDLPAEFR